MRHFLITLLFVTPAAFASIQIQNQSQSLEEIEKGLNMQLGFQIAKIYCPGQAKTRALGFLDQVDMNQCGFAPADLVERAVEALPLDSIPQSGSFWWDSAPLKKANQCASGNLELQPMLSKVQKLSQRQCQLMGHSECQSLPPEFYYTSDSFCVGLVKTQKTATSKNVEVEKLLAAKEKMKEVLKLYEKAFCDNVAIKVLLEEAKQLMLSANPQPTPEPHEVYGDLCILLEH
jgi:hypothetical protein